MTGNGKSICLDTIIYLSIGVVKGNLGEYQMVLRIEYGVKRG